MVVEIASTVVSPAIFPPNVPRKRSPGVGEAGEPATNVEMKVISLETVLPNRPVGVGTATIVVSLGTCLPTVPRRGSLGAEVVEVAHVMDVERKGISRETVPARLEVVEVEDASIVGKMVIS